ncbi:hypothetical protein ACE4ZV_27070, partial [Salmonella enterica]|uniref:hypothetical protein n=1 Tax=Salmonella enterica TaxID=28901 RepID=UPI003D2A6304
RPLDLPDSSAWSARDAAFALARHPERAIALIHSGALDRWLRRSLADPALATRLEVALRIKPGDPEGDTPRAQALLL